MLVTSAMSHEEARLALRKTRLKIVDFSMDGAAKTAEFLARGISLGDRACMTTALLTGLPAVTADRSSGRLARAQSSDRIYPRCKLSDDDKSATAAADLKARLKRSRPAGRATQHCVPKQAAVWLVVIRWALMGPAILIAERGRTPSACRAIPQGCCRKPWKAVRTFPARFQPCH